MPDIGSLWISCTGPVCYAGFKIHDFNDTHRIRQILSMQYYSFTIENRSVIFVVDVNLNALTADLLIGAEKHTVVWKNILISSRIRRLSNKNKKQLPFFTIYEYEKLAASKVYQRKYIRQPIRLRQVCVYKRIQRCSRGT